MPGKPALRITELPACRIDEQKVRRFKLSNRQGMTVELMEYGATLLRVLIPDPSGVPVQVNLSLPEPQQYAHNPAYMGATCGRVANRIGHSRFSLNGRLYTLAANNGEHHLHGGITGFNRRIWRGVPGSKGERVGVRFEYPSPDGEEGYPGTLHCQVEYTLNDVSELSIRYQASVDSVATVVNLTNHSYWNLAGRGSILGHELELFARSVVEVDQEMIPTGVIRPVAGTAFDFTSPRPVGERIEEVRLDINDRSRAGYDHCYLLEDNLNRTQSEPVLAARVTDPVSGRVMEVMTDQPGIQFYSGIYLDGTEATGGFAQYGGLCLECQQLPDAPNQPAFPDIVLNPGETYRQSSSYRFRW